MDAASLNDLDFWDKGGERAEERYVVTSRPGHLEARWEQPHKYGDRWSMSNVHTESKTEKWESGSAASSNSSHFDFSSNAGEKEKYIFSFILINSFQMKFLVKLA